jgi:hypothetical protein
MSAVPDGRHHQANRDGRERWMTKAYALLERIKAFPFVEGAVVVRKVGRGYSLLSARTGASIARLRPTGEADRVQVLWWNGKRWGASGTFGLATMPLDKALDHIATEPAFWIHA